MDATISGSMSQDHKAWRHEHTKWLKDIRRWQAQSQSAIDDLKEVRSFFVEHDHALSAHGRPIFDHEEVLAPFELGLPQCLDAQHSREDMLAAHEELAARHERLHEAHERIRKRHDAVMARLSGLVAEIRRAM